MKDASTRPTQEDITIVISSCKKYSPTTLPILTTSLLKAGFHTDEIVVVSGGYDARKETKKYNNLTYIEVEQNSFDLTALIDVVENDFIKTGYCFLLHDTCYVGPSFKKLVIEHDYKSTNCIKLCSGSSIGPSMNIGLYSKKFLFENKETLINLKNLDNTPQGIQQAKRRAVESEDILFFLHECKEPVKWFCTKFQPLETSASTIYNNVDVSSARKIDYYPELDLYKLKANFSMGSEYVVDI